MTHNTEENNKYSNPYWNKEDFVKRQARGRIAGGIILIILGGLWLIHEIGMEIPYPIYSWNTVVILFGLYLLIKNGLYQFWGYFLLVLGMLEFVDSELPFRKYFWPISIISGGLYMLISAWKKNRTRHSKESLNSDKRNTQNSNTERFTIHAILGGAEKNIQTDDFKGGEINCILGGAEINMIHAEIQGTVTIEVNAIFGGIELTVPSHWKIQYNVSAILGGVSDNRITNLETIQTDKILILNGNAIFGGIEIK